MKAGVVIGVLVVVAAGIAWSFWPGYKPTFLGGPEPLPSPTVRDNRMQEVGKDRFKFWPASAEVEQGVEYQFRSDHCGLDFLTDFDGSFWIPEEVPGDGPTYYYNEDDGTMTLVSSDRALYVSSDGQETNLTRHPGPITVKRLCA